MGRRTNHCFVGWLFSLQVSNLCQWSPPVHRRKQNVIIWINNRVDNKPVSFLHPCHQCKTERNRSFVRHLWSTQNPYSAAAYPPAQTQRGFFNIYFNKVRLLYKILQLYNVFYLLKQALKLSSRYPIKFHRNRAVCMFRHFDLIYI